MAGEHEPALAPEEEKKAVEEMPIMDGPQQEAATEPPREQTQEEINEHAEVT